MPDITMCRGGRCPLRHNCARFCEEPSPVRQAWFTELPYDRETRTCRHELPLDKHDWCARFD